MSTSFHSENKFSYEAPSIYRKRYLKNNNNVILKSKENLIKSKCHRTLVKKLKKYKVRRDGLEDPDVLDISKTFHLSLKLKSPNKDTNIIHNDNDRIKVTNYLFKMVRHGKTKSNTITTPHTITTVDDEDNITKSNTITTPHTITTVDDEDNITKSNTITTPHTITTVDDEDNITKNTNAFDLMMNSRNKSIGSNSPGKEKPCDDADTYEKDLQKANKLKRSLALLKMSEAKGVKEKRVLEELKDKCIKKKMDDRAERLKVMLTKGGKIKKPSKIHPETNKKENNIIKVKEGLKKDTSIKKDEQSKCADNKEDPKIDKFKQNIVKILPLVDVDLFTSPKIIKNKLISKDDEEFLNKLSPSLKNRDMLCYFKKVNKVSPNNTQNDEDSADEININSENIIKVKLISRSKKKNKKKKLSLKKRHCNGDPSNNTTIDKHLSDDVCSNADGSSNNKISKDCNMETNCNILNSSEDICADVDILHNNIVGTSKDIVVKAVKVNCKKFKNIGPYNWEAHVLESNENYQNGNITDNNTAEVTSISIKTPVRKRKRISLEIDMKHSNNMNLPENNSKELRPKHNVKKPTKYSLQLSSSDEDLHIFTPKKKKSGKTPLKEEKKMHRNKKVKSECETIVLIDSDDKDDKKVNIIKKTKPVENKKLAPIFAVKPLIDAATREAKQTFLYSGIPERIKKIESQAKKNVPENYFFVTTHVQQLCTDDSNSFKFNYSYDDSDEDDEMIIFSTSDYKSLLNIESKITEDVSPDLMTDVKLSLQTIKQLYPEFPVYRTYNLFKNKYNKDGAATISLDNSSEVIDKIGFDSQIDSPHLTWTEKYRVTYAKDIIGNFDGIKELKKWLQSWQENEASSKRNTTEYDSDSSDFYYHSDTDSRDSMRGINNLLVVTGPVGCGKTSSVYAVAAELYYKVIEVNVGSKRTGKIILQDLQEATQSHKVNRTKGTTSENSQEHNSNRLKNGNLKTKGIPSLKSKKKMLKTYGNPEPISRTYSQEVSRTEMSLILIDDADIILEQDDGFAAGLSQIVQCSKRPVILVTSSLTCQHLQKFFNCGNIVELHPLGPQMLGTWLDIMCLSGTGLCWPGFGNRCLDHYKGDIRKSINYLQYLFMSQANRKSNRHENDSPVMELEDESSSTSWADGSSNKKLLDSTLNISKYKFTEFSYCENMDTLWWNIPKILLQPRDDLSDCNDLKMLKNVSDVLDCLSLVDAMRRGSGPGRSALAGPWGQGESDGVSESDNVLLYSAHAHQIDGVADWIMECCLRNANTSFLEDNIDKCLPGSNERRSRDKVVSHHHSLSECVSLCSVLQRVSLGLDYWALCRSLCRAERERADSRRNGRYCHYLHSSTLKQSAFNMLCKSLETINE